MKRINLFCLFLFLIILFQPVFSEDEIFLLKDIKPGMKGYGKTVFEGTKIEKFPITVLGVSKKFYGDQDIILVRIDGGYCVEHETAVIAGMSGSPVYIDDKLAGAIAYGWGFSKEPIAGVTPIEGMFEHLMGISSLSRSDDKSAPPAPLIVEGREIKKVKPGIVKKDDFIPDDTLILEPLTGYFTISGLSEKAVKRLNEKLNGVIHFESGGGGYVDYDKNPSIEPGSAVGVILLKGDIIASATGTLTYKKGNTLLAFGHEMLNMGPTNIPFTVSYIHGINPSYLNSRKLASPIKDIGAMVLDRANGVKAIEGEKPDLFPVQITCRDITNKITRTFNVEVIDHPFLTPHLLASAVWEGICQFTSAFTREQKTKVKFTYSFHNYKDLTREDLYYYYLYTDADIEFGMLTESLMMNDYQKLKFKKITVDVEIESQKAVAQILKLSADKYRVKPGQEIELNIFYKPYNDNIKTEKIRFKVPDYLQKGKIKVGSSGGGNYEELDRKLRIPEEKIFNFRQFLKNKFDAEKNNVLLTKIVFPEETLRIYGDDYASIPELFVRLWGKIFGSGTEIMDRVQVERASTQWVISGLQVLELEITSEKDSKEDSDKEKPKEDKEDSEEEISFAGSSDIYNKVIKKKFSNKPYPSDSVNKYKEEKKAEDEKNEDKDSKEKKESKDKKTDKDLKEDKAKKEKKYLALPYRYFEDNLTPHFLKGEFENTALDSSGKLSLSFAMEKIYSTDSQLVCGVYDFKNNVLYVADSSGNIIKLPDEKVFSNIPERVINTMAVDSSGGLYAGTSPNGNIYKITSSGNANLLVKLPVSHIWKLEFKNRELFAASGSPGRFYKINSAGKYTLFFDSRQQHIRSFCFARGGEIYLATGNNGFIYKLNPSGSAMPVFQEKGICIEGIAENSGGNIYFGWQNYFIGLTKDKIMYIYELLGDKFVTSIEADGEGLIIGTAFSGKIFHFQLNNVNGKKGSERSEGSYFDGIDSITLLHDLKEADITGIVKGSPGNYYVIACGDSGVYQLKTKVYSRKGRFTSRVFDTENFSFWGKANWLARILSGTGITLQFRSGFTAKPDKSWSDWSGIVNSFSEFIQSPKARFIQYAASFTTGNAAITPLLEAVRIYYKYVEKLPYLEIVTPRGLSYFSKEAELEWSTGDANLDELFFDLYCQKEGEKDWKEIVRALPVYAKKDDIKKDENPGNISQVYLWDLKNISDGRYRLKFLVYNGNSPDDKKLINFQISSPVIVCNTEPEIEISKEETRGGNIYIEGIAKSRLVPIGSIKYTLGESDYPAIIKDRLLDSVSEAFVIQAPAKKEKFLEIEVLDMAGNKKNKKITF